MNVIMSNKMYQLSSISIKLNWSYKNILFLNALIEKKFKKTSACTNPIPIKLGCCVKQKKKNTMIANPVQFILNLIQLEMLPASLDPTSSEMD